MLVYKGESLDIREEPWLGWIIADTQQTAERGEYVALVDHEDSIITTVLDQALGREMIDVGEATDVGDRIHGMIQRLMSPPHNKAQPPQEILEFYKIFKTISKGPLQTLISTMMPVRNLNKDTSLKKDTKGVVQA